MKYCNGGHEQDENEASLPFSLRSATREVRDHRILEWIASSKAYFTGWKQHGMDGWSWYLQNEHKWVFIILWPLASHEILFTGFSYECKKLVPFPFFINF